MSSYIKSEDINDVNANVYTLGTKAKISTSLDVKFQSSTGNNVNKNDLISLTPVDAIKSAINVLETKFSLNCCQANCNSTSNYTYKSGTKTNYKNICQNQCSTTTYYYYYNDCGCMD